MEIIKEFWNNLDLFEEDMYYAECGNIQIDVGFYRTVFRIYIIKDANFDSPIDEIAFRDSELLEYFLDIFKQRLLSGYYKKLDDTSFRYEQHSSRG